MSTSPASFVLASAALLAACGGGYHARGPDGARGVAAAGLPFAILDGRTGREVATADFWDRLRAARAVCAGEQHPSPHDHWMQLQIVDHLTAPSGRGLGVGLEMVQQPFQGVLDDWGSKRVDDAAFLARTAWAQRWGFDFDLYRPILALARDRGAALVALNAPSELVKQVARQGVDGLTAADRARLPALELGDAQHRAWFDQVMAAMSDDHGAAHAHGPPPDDKAAPAAPADADHAGAPVMPSMDNVYAAQVVWDESMADGAARWLAAGGQRLVILAGNGHCHDSAIVRRLGRRGVTGVTSVRPIIDDGEGNVAAAIAEGINDYLFVMTPPAAAPAAAPATPATPASK